MDTIATAPWNRAALEGAPARLSGLGRLVLMAAIGLSHAWGTDGGIALRPAETALTWYQEMFPDGLVSEDGEWMEISGAVASSFEGAHEAERAMVQKLLTRGRWRSRGWWG